MKIQSIEIELFLAITQAEIKLSDRGLVLIQGVNSLDTSAKSNGAGKSSIADSVCWCLYGVTARGVTGDDVVNNEAGKGTRVMATIEDGDDLYRIARHRKHKTGKNSLQVRKWNKATAMFDIDLTKGTDKLTQAVVDRIIGASYEVFKGAIYAGQEQMPDLPAMTDKQLKLLLEEASGTVLLEEAYKEANKGVLQAKADIDEVRSKTARLADMMAVINNQIHATENNVIAWDAAKDNFISEGRQEVADRLKNISAMDADLAARDIPGMEAFIATCTVKIAATKQESERYSNLLQEAATARSDAKGAAIALNNAETLLKGAKALLGRVEHQIGCPCTECGRTITEKEMAASKKAAQAKIDEVQAIFDKLTEELTAAEKLATEKAWAAQAFKSKMTDISEVNEQRNAKSEQLREAQTKKHHRDKYTMETKALGERIKAKAAEDNPHTATLEKLRADMTKIEGAELAMAEKEKELQKALDVAEAVAKIYSPSGVRAYILDEVTPFLNQQTAKYLATLSDGNITATWTTLVKNAKGDLKEKFAIEVEKKNGAKLFAGLSGGEKRKVRIASALALQDLVATRASKPIDLFIADEIDDAMDDAGLERLMQILEDKATERGSIFIISHNNLKDWISNVIIVENDGKKTTVKEV